MTCCNIPNFGTNTYRHVLIDYDDYLDVLFYIGLRTPLHMNMMIFFYILGISQLLMIYVYACFFWPWTLKHMIDEMFFVERGAMEHLSD